MVEGHAHVTICGVTKSYHLTPLEWVGIVAHRAGFAEVDAEPTGVANQWRVTAKGTNMKVSQTGSSLHEACSKLVESMQ
jgi:hypothetical protein